MTATSRAVNTFIANMDRRAEDGLLDIAPLEFVMVIAGFGKQDAKNGVEATDKEFIGFMSDCLDGTRAEQRLAFRMLMIAVTQKLGIDLNHHVRGRVKT